MYFSLTYNPLTVSAQLLNAER